jgi:hypothetical protein
MIEIKLVSSGKINLPIDDLDRHCLKLLKYNIAISKSADIINEIIKLEVSFIIGFASSMLANWLYNILKENESITINIYINGIESRLSLSELNKTVEIVVKDLEKE